jgi:hypothetical protein
MHARVCLFAHRRSIWAAAASAAVSRLPVLSACLPPVNSAEAAAGFPAPCVLQVTGCIKYNGQEASQFVLRRTAAYVDQLDYHIPSLTVRGGLVVGPCVCW